MSLPLNSDQVSLDGFLDFLEIEPAARLSVPAMLVDASKFYRQFEIPKRKGGTRTVRSPYPSLALIQKSLLKIVLQDLPINDCAFAYCRGSNAIQHAAIHLSGDELLTLDILDFFHSVSRQMVYQVFLEANLPPLFCQFASLICCFRNSLPQGACTSPVLSNLIFYRLDFRLSRLAKKIGVNYSRYADDLAFSGPIVPVGLIRSVERILNSRDFQINHSKTRLKLAGAKKIVTGVSISSGILKAPKKFKRTLRSQVYEIEKNLDNLSNMPKLDPFVFERVLGRLNYLLQIEPENGYAREKKSSLSQSHQNLLSLVNPKLISLVFDENQ